MEGKLDIGKTKHWDIRMLTKLTPIVGIQRFLDRIPAKPLLITFSYVESKPAFENQVEIKVRGFHPDMLRKLRNP